MQVKSTTSQFNKSPKFYNTTAYVQKNQMLSRSLVDMFGIAIPWAVMANNKDESRERAIRFSIGFIIPYLTPFVTLPLSNRAALKSFKITKKFWSKNNPLIQISNEHLSNAKDLKKGWKLLEEEVNQVITRRNIKRKKLGLKQKEEFSLKDALIEYMPKTKDIEKKSVDDLLDIIDGDKLRKKLITAKNSVLSSDLLFTSILWSGAPWIANHITKVKTGKTGFSAEYTEENKDLVEKRAENHEKNKKKKYGIVLAACITVGTLVPLVLASALRRPNANKIAQKIAKKAKGFDYTEGIFMKKPSIFLMASCGAFLGSLLATRDRTELKDTLIRLGAVELLYFTGDGIIASLLARAIEKTTDMKLIDNNKKKDSLWNRIFPPLKSMQKLDIKLSKETNEVAKKHMKKEMKTLQGLYWTGMLGLMATLGFALPYAMNKLIKSDVEKLEKEHNKFNNNEFLRNIVDKKIGFNL